MGRTAIPAPDRLGLRRSPARRSRRSGRRTGAPGSHPGGPAATRCARRPAAGFATRRGTPPRTSGRRSAAGRSCDQGADAASGPTPGRLLRGGRSAAGAGRFCFCPCEGGLDELPGVFGGRVSSSSRASRAAMRASCAAMWAPCAAIRWSANTSRRSAPRSARPSRRGSVERGAGSRGTRSVELTRP